MPVFQPRNRIEILREMVARVIARSKLVKLTRNSVVFHVLAAAANEDAEQYVQMARLRNLFSIDRARGSDLDERAKEILPGTISRRGALFASGDVTFSRPGTTGTISIPAGSQVAAEDADGKILFRTVASASINDGNTDSGPVGVVATVAGSRHNVAAGAINQLVSRISGVTSVTNGAAFENGRDRESDESFRSRLKSFVQAISRGTPRSLIGFAVNVILADGRRVLFAAVDEPIVPDGTVDLVIDDGTGNTEEFDDTFIGSSDTFLTSATGGEKNIFTSERPIRDDGSFALEIDTGSGYVTQVRGTDFELNPAIGQIELSNASWPTGLPVGASARANYRYYTGLIRETQRVLDGDPANPLRYSGVRAAGVQVHVVAADPVFQSVTGQISVLPDFDPTVVLNNVEAAILDYINSLGIGENVIAAEIIERAMGVTGMFNFKLTDLTGSSPAADQVILETQVARITSASITLT